MSSYPSAVFCGSDGGVLCGSDGVVSGTQTRQAVSMRRYALLFLVLLTNAACTNGQTSASTTTLVPIQGDPRYPTTSTLTTLSPTTTTTRLIGHVDSAKQMTDDELTALAIAVFQAQIKGFGSEDPDLAA